MPILKKIAALLLIMSGLAAAAKETPENPPKRTLPLTGTSANSALVVYYFEKPGCMPCVKLAETMCRLEREYPGRLIVRRHKLSDAGGKVLNEALCIKYGVPEKSRLTAPAVFIGSRYFIGGKSVSGADLAGIIRAAIANPAAYPPPHLSEGELLNAERSVKLRFEKMTWTAVAAAGLLDGINPCAFVTIIFLLSYLSLLKFGAWEKILAAAGFTCAVFVTYLLIGFGILGFVSEIHSLPRLPDFVHYAAAALCAASGIMNIRDYLKIRGGTLKDMDMKLAAGSRLEINRLIREKLRIRHYILGAIFIGFSVSLIELACTGQAYLPTILFIIGVHGAGLRASSMLVLYNAAFVIPILAVFALFLCGVSDKKFSAWLERNGGGIKLATGVLLLALAAWLTVAGHI